MNSADKAFTIVLCSLFILVAFVSALIAVDHIVTTQIAADVIVAEQCAP